MDDDFERWLKDRDPQTDVGGAGLAPGTTVGTYRVEALLGRGGFAEVYRAKDETDRPVAVKMLHRLDAKSRLRFEREARILAQIRHPNLPRFLGFGVYGDRPYAVTELLYACELPQGDRAVARFLTAVMSAVEELHRHGFVHRDIKPANILRRADGEPVLIDFGLAVPISEAVREASALSVEGDVKVAVGTIGFSAPEQFAGRVSGPASDVHALGALVGACFGERMPRCWRRIYLKATNSNPDVRYQTVASLRRDVVLRHVENRILVILGVILLVIAAYIAFGAVRKYNIENRHPTHFRE